jgi:hypothetical protein
MPDDLADIAKRIEALRPGDALRLAAELLEHGEFAVATAIVDRVGRELSALQLAAEHPVSQEQTVSRRSVDTLPAFDPDFSPSHDTNLAAARARHWHFDVASQQYQDDEDYPVADRFGQDLG